MWPELCQCLVNQVAIRVKRDQRKLILLYQVSAYFLSFVSKEQKKINLLAVETGSNLAILTKRKEKSACALSFELFYFSIDHCIFVYFDLPNFGEKKFNGIFISEYSKNDHSKEIHVI